ncbi:MAG: hypothetical protein CMK44_01110 [Porticoccus sp.]|nr:hypothetical protein [Porticoccus sp.]|tara:strand:+ start:410 stop:886 length:477 start_codon:yes stop_codon:yes gene_type:complete
METNPTEFDSSSPSSTQDVLDEMNKKSFKKEVEDLNKGDLLKKIYPLMEDLIDEYPLHFKTPKKPYTASQSDDDMVMDLDKQYERLKGVEKSILIEHFANLKLLQDKKRSIPEDAFGGGRRFKKSKKRRKSKRKSSKKSKRRKSSKRKSSKRKSRRRR